MRFDRGGRAVYGEVEEGLVWALEGDPFNGRRSGESFEVDGLRVLPPCEPTKILAVGLNYRSHLAGRPVPRTPELFLKPPSSLVASGEEIVIPKEAEDVHFEGEMAVVIGKKTKGADRVEAVKSIFGVTCGNDVSDRGWQKGERKDLQWWRAKGCDTFAPLGPAIAVGLDWSSLVLETRVNGRSVQRESTADLIHDAPAVVSWASQWITLLPGDVIYMGTPGTTFRLNPGDVVEVELEGVGILWNPVK